MSLLPFGDVAKDALAIVGVAAKVTAGVRAHTTGASYSSQAPGTSAWPGRRPRTCNL